MSAGCVGSQAGHPSAHQLQRNFSPGSDKSGGGLSVTARVLPEWLAEGSVLNTLSAWNLDIGQHGHLPGSNTPELHNLNFDVQLVVFLLSIVIIFIKDVNVSSLGFQTDTLRRIFISKSRGWRSELKIKGGICTKSHRWFWCKLFKGVTAYTQYLF